MNRIKYLRQERGWTQAQLAKKMGLVKSTICGYEDESHQPDVPKIHALCDLFGCTADYLLGRSSSPLPAVTDEQACLLAAYDAASVRDRALVAQILQLDVVETKTEANAS